MKGYATILLILFIIGECMTSKAFYLYQPRIVRRPYGIKARETKMLMDDFVLRKLDSIRRTFDIITERLADPDVGNDRKLLLSLSRERASLEKTVEAYKDWRKLQEERQSLEDMEISGQVEADMKDVVKDELRMLTTKQAEIEDAITIMLLPQDPNDDRNVMLEIRAASGGDEAGIFAGDLMNVYRKYCEREGWKVSIISSSLGDAGGFKVVVLQITGDHVYSKLKYEVR
jgi:peptide chain release factor 1